MKKYVVIVTCWVCLLLPGPFARAGSEMVKVETVEKDGSRVIVASNTSRMPVVVTLKLSSFSNLSSNRNWPIQVRLAGGQSMEVAEVAAANKQFGYTINYTSQFIQGDPKARHDANVSYRIPFVAAQGYQILQAADGPIFSHQSVASRYAVDIRMPMGTTVVAARAGYVVEVVSHFADDGKASPEFMDKANYVRVLHNDGSWADYFHLMQNSVRVEVGQQVSAGEVLGLSGNSGYSTTPHLHFHVQINQNDTIVSLPFQFHNTHDGVFVPRYQSWLIPDTAVDVAGKLKTRKDMRECLPASKVIDAAVIRCLSAS